LSTLAELSLLGSIYAGTENFNNKQAKTEIKRCCQEMRDLFDSNAFPICSTRRQFKRYQTYWPKPEWNGLAEEALKALG